jgi:hypothetical protein
MSREEIWRVSRLQTVIWATSDGVRCVVARYDESRYQLRLLRTQGTVKADLFASLSDANRAANRWRAEVIEHDSDEWPQQLASEDRRERGGTVARPGSPCASDNAEQRAGRHRRLRAAAPNPARERSR